MTQAVVGFDETTGKWYCERATPFGSVRDLFDSEEDAVAHSNGEKGGCC